jgi:integrase
MRGHIKKRYKNSYTIVLNLGIDLSTGKRKQKWVSVKGTKKDAETRLAELLHQLDTGYYIDSRKTTFAEFLERWLKDYVWPNLSPRTAEGYESIVRKHLIPKLGNIALSQIKPEHLQNYYSDRLKSGRCNGKGGLNPLTVRHHHMAIHCALQTAVKWGLISRNPADAVSTPKAQRKDIHIMSEQQLQSFLNEAKRTPYYSLFYLALFTGMRRSELLALRWRDLDLVKGTVYVSRSLHHLLDKTLVFRQTKTAKGRRTVALPTSCMLEMINHKEEQQAIKTMLGESLTDNNLVFSQPEGSPLLPDTISHAWTKIAKRAGIEGIRLHDARHSHASFMLKQGTHPKIVQERLGHASIQTTLDVYSHVVPGLQEAAAKRFDEMMNSATITDTLSHIN